MSKRPRSGGTSVAKKYKSALDKLADEFICPITSELPVDPVTAEDGRVYEKSALLEWFATKPEDEIKSPVTNEPMGKRLLPAVQVAKLRASRRSEETEEGEGRVYTIISIS